MKEIINQNFEGERSLFKAEDLFISRCNFDNGESPLKHSRDITAEHSEFRFKYPFWYSRDISITDSTFYEMARAGIWYSEDVSVKNSIFIAPKAFRRCKDITLENVKFMDAAETLWDCTDVSIRNVEVKGDYFGMNCLEVEADGLSVDGNYCFDGARYLTIRNSRLISKDAFWNCESVLCENCHISGEYLGWNSKEITFINCTIESHQGLCFIDGLVLKNCKLVNTDLAFEYSSDIEAELIGSVDSIKNPSGGVIRCESVVELILEEDMVDISKTQIIIGRGAEE